MDKDKGEAKHNDVWNFQDVDNGHQSVPNQSKFGLEYVSWKQFFCFQTKVELVWKILRIFWV